MKYYIPAHGETAKDAEDIKGADDVTNPERYAMLASLHCFSEHDGWEWEWPIEMIIIDENGVEHCFEVEREFDPVFYATRKEKS